MLLYLGTYSGELFMLSGHPTQLGLRRKNQISDKSIRCINLPQKSDNLLVGGFEGQLIAVDKEKLVVNKQTKDSKSVINCIQDIKGGDENIVAIGYENGLVRFWNWDKWTLRKEEMREHKRAVRGFSQTEDGVVFGSICSKSLILWSTANFKSRFHYKFQYDIEHLLFEENFQTIFLLNQKQIHQIDSQTNEQISVYNFYEKSLSEQSENGGRPEMIQSALLFGKFLIVGGDKGRIYVWNIDDSEKSKEEDNGNSGTKKNCFEHRITFQAFENIRVKCMKRVHFDQIDYLITAGTNGQIKVWDVLEFLKEIDNIGQNYDLKLQPLYACGIGGGSRVICMEVGLIDFEVSNQIKKAKVAAERNDEEQKQMQEQEDVQQGQGDDNGGKNLDGNNKKSHQKGKYILGKKMKAKGKVSKDLNREKSKLPGKSSGKSSFEGETSDLKGKGKKKKRIKKHNKMKMKGSQLKS